MDELKIPGQSFPPAAPGGDWSRKHLGVTVAWEDNGKTYSGVVTSPGLLTGADGLPTTAVVTLHPTMSPRHKDGRTTQIPAASIPAAHALWLQTFVPPPIAESLAAAIREQTMELIDGGHKHCCDCPNCSDEAKCIEADAKPILPVDPNRAVPSWCPLRKTRERGAQIRGFLQRVVPDHTYPVDAELILTCCAQDALPVQDGEPKPVGEKNCEVFASGPFITVLVSRRAFKFLRELATLSGFFHRVSSMETMLKERT